MRDIYRLGQKELKRLGVIVPIELMDITRAKKNGGYSVDKEKRLKQAMSNFMNTPDLDIDS